jgi:hypothetical protein
LLPADGAAQPTADNTMMIDRWYPDHREDQ